MTLRRVPAGNMPDRDHHRVEDVELPGHHGLQARSPSRPPPRSGRPTACGREACPPTPRTVTDIPAEAAISGPGRVAKTPRGRVLENTCSPYAADDPGPGRVQHPLGDHRRRAVCPSSPGWNMKTTSPGSSARWRLSSTAAPTRAGGVQVVAAGVHHPGGRREGLAGLLGHRQGVHVGPQQHRRSRRRAGAAQHPDDRGERAARGSSSSAVSARASVTSGLGTRQLQARSRPRHAGPGAAREGGRTVRPPPRSSRWQKWC